MKRIAIALLIVSIAFVKSHAGGVNGVQKELKRLKKDSVSRVEVLGNMLWIRLKNGKEYLISSDGRYAVENPKVIDLMKKKVLKTVDDLIAGRKPDVDKVAYFYLYKAGKPKALVVVDEYCPYCERFVSDLIELLKVKKPKYDIAVTFFPVHRESVEASCKLLGLPAEKAKEIYVEWIKTGDQNVWKGLKCSRENQRELINRVTTLRILSGVTGTPTVILPSGEKIVGYRNPEEVLF